MSNKTLIIFALIILTLVTVGAHLISHPDVLPVAQLLAIATGVLWIVWIVSRFTGRVIARIDAVEQAHAVRIYADAVAVPDDRPRLRGLS